MDVWAANAAERRSLVEGLRSLTPEQWDAPSLCADWAVRDVVAHLVSTSQMTPPKFFGKLIGSGFNFSRMTAGEISRVTTEAGGDAGLVEALAARVDARTAPPGPVTSWLGETIVHGQDVFRALGIDHANPVENVIAVADFYSGSNLLIGTKNRIDGVRLAATDADWSHGSGPEIAGPAITLLLAMTGRKAVLDELTGDGVAVLRSRP